MTIMFTDKERDNLQERTKDELIMFLDTMTWALKEAREEAKKFENLYECENEIKQNYAKELENYGHNFISLQFVAQGNFQGFKEEE